MTDDPLHKAWLYIGRCPPRNAAAVKINRIAIDRWFMLCEAMFKALKDAEEYDREQRRA